jgi:predicted MFS family arabinose efflux permease
MSDDKDTGTLITRRQRNYTLGVLVLVFTSSHIDRQIVAILGQPIKDALAISDTQLGLLTGVMFALFYATLGMPMAMWADRRNRRNLIAFSIALWSGMTALCGIAQNYTQLLLARIGVGVGEAGSNPPSHSIIADLYGPAERATALAIFGTGVNAGIMFGFLIGGWVNEWLGWRWAFIVAGLPGLAIAILVRLTVQEPPRGYSERFAASPSDSPATSSSDTSDTQAPPFWAVARTLARNPILRNTIVANTLVSFFGYALVLWVPVYLVRVHEMGTGEVGTILALLVGLGGAVGTYFGGLMADKLSARHPGWRAWVVVVAYVVALPLAALAFLAESASATIALYVLPAMLAGAYIGPSFAIIQSHVPLRMRSVAAAINLFILNIIGLGLGPFSVGLISDLTADAAGVNSLRYGLLAMIPVGLWGILHYLRAGILLGREAQ